VAGDGVSSRKRFVYSSGRPAQRDRLPSGGSGVAAVSRRRMGPSGAEGLFMTRRWSGYNAGGYHRGYPPAPPDGHGCPSGRDYTDVIERPTRQQALFRTSCPRLHKPLLGLVRRRVACFSVSIIHPVRPSHVDHSLTRGGNVMKRSPVFGFHGSGRSPVRSPSWLAQWCCHCERSEAILLVYNTIVNDGVLILDCTAKPVTES
jgi:hypothetical protein